MQLGVGMNVKACPQPAKWITNITDSPLFAATFCFALFKLMPGALPKASPFAALDDGVDDGTALPGFGLADEQQVLLAHRRGPVAFSTRLLSISSGGAVSESAKQG
jgi:hypothetical protein